MTSKGNSRRRPLRAPPASAWLAQLNDVLGDASRRLFQSQLVLRAASEREIRAQLPGLCALATSLCQAASASSAQRHAIRSAFGDPQAQWLSRGAVESGASGFFCHLLLREIAAIQEENDDGHHHHHAARLVVQLLLDPVLKHCHDRAVESRACEWRFEKPKYYAMTCANLWETLLPFLARAARQHAVVFGDVLNELIQIKRLGGSHRVNCRFGQVAGFWRLLEALGDAKTLDQLPAVRELMPKILAFAVRWSVLCDEEEDLQVVDMTATECDALSDPHAKFYDLLLEKFFQDMQEFLFKCAHATPVARTALRSILELHMSARPLGAGPLQVRFVAFAALACLLVKGVASDASEVIKNQSSMSLTNPAESNFLLVVGFVSHIEAIKTSTILSVVHELLDRYTEFNGLRTERRDVLLWVIYIVVCRQVALDASSNKESITFRRFQERICTVIIEDLQLMPVHWMEIVWKVCIGLHNDEVSAFTEEARAFRVSSMKHETGDIFLPWENHIQRVPNRRLDQYTAVMAILGSRYTESLKRTDPTPAQSSGDVMEKLVQQVSNKRRRLRRDVVVLSDEHEQSRQNALLLTEVMEKISSFMSAKRLCRLSLVCRAFAGVSRSERLWKPLYFQLIQPLKVKCRHGGDYEHDWRLMYQAKYIAIKKMRSRQQAAARKAQRGDMAFCWHEDDHELRMSVTINSAQLCQECGCNHLSATSEAAKAHRILHQKYRCPEGKCREALASASALNQHMKSAHHPKAIQKQSNRDATETIAVGHSDAVTKGRHPEKAPLLCVVDGCNRSYKSKKWLQNHVQREHGIELPHDPRMETNPTV